MGERSFLERAFGQSRSAVGVNAAGPGGVSLGAQAYSTGQHVNFAGTPDLHTAAHEAAHLEQQRKRG